MSSVQTERVRVAGQPNAQPSRTNQRRGSRPQNQNEEKDNAAAGYQVMESEHQVGILSQRRRRPARAKRPNAAQAAAGNQSNQSNNQPSNHSTVQIIDPPAFQPVTQSNISQAIGQPVNQAGDRRRNRGRQHNAPNHMTFPHPDLTNSNNNSQSSVVQPSSSQAPRRRPRNRPNHASSLLSNPLNDPSNIRPTNQSSSQSNNQQSQNQSNLDYTVTAMQSFTAVDSGNTSKLAANLMDSLRMNTYDCCICHELIGRRAAIWSCNQCYTLVHQSCIERWYKAKQSQAGSLPVVQWPCPACLASYEGRPPPYHCYCGRTSQPEFNPYLIPHACGQICGKRRARPVSSSEASVAIVIECPHQCTQLCHPGSCGLCPIFVAKQCGCGRTELQIRCGSLFDQSAHSCETLCGKTLSCSLHQCQRPCHSGDCGDCSLVTHQTCWCGKSEVDQVCHAAQAVDEHGQQRFSCHDVCGRVLGCGNHYCQELCHSGPCGECSLLPTRIQLCACGKSSRESWHRESCSDPLPTCELVCGRVMECGRHKCNRPCHEGVCGKCEQLVKRACRCGHDVVTLSCHAVDASADLLTCNKLCRKLLSCGKHRCSNRCCPDGSEHLCIETCGRPLDCGNHACDSFCHGSSSCSRCTIVFRDGVICACGRTRTRPNVPCGTVAQCPYQCGKIRSCGHQCILPCHSGECQNNAPCPILTNKMCAGSHKEMRNIPCFAQNPSCGKTCGQLLPCGTHTCLRPCHAGHDAENSSVDACTQKCGKTRTRCDHTCRAVCHPGSECPETPCEQLVALRCACGRKSRDVRCCIATDDITLDCDEACLVAQRNSRFRSALGVQEARAVIPYPAPLLDRVLDLNLLELCSRFERRINDWLDDSNTPTKMFPNMPATHRWILHQLASYYDLHSESFDQEPHRSVRMQRSAASQIPSVSLSSAARTYQQHKSTSSAPRTVDALVHFVELDLFPAVAPADLHSMLGGFVGRYRLNWLDSHAHAFAVVESAALATQIAEAITKKGLWRTKPDEDSLYAHELPVGVSEDSLCLYRKLRINERGTREACIKERESRKKTVSDDGFTQVGKLRPMNNQASPVAASVAAAPLNRWTTLLDSAYDSADGARA